MDSSAVVAIVREEPESALFRAALARAAGHGGAVIGAPTVVELAAVLRRDEADLDTLLARLGIEAVPFTAEHGRVAREAYRRYGRGTGSPAKLNYGDVMSYAVARVAGLPLLYKGDDFAHTDVAPAVPPA